MTDGVANQRSIVVDLLNHVKSEYREMPGLQLTLAQASRLWDVTVAVSQQVFDELVETAFLRRSGEHYVRADSGSAR